jgi:hypothetical protein
MPTLSAVTFLAKIFSDKTVSIMADEDDRLDFGFADIS